MTRITVAVTDKGYIGLMSEREILEREVASHRARVEELLDQLRQVGDGAARAGLMRMELKGRNAAVEIGTARLRMLRD